MSTRMSNETLPGQYVYAITPDQIAALETMGWEVDEPAQLVTPPGWVQAMPYPALDGGIGLHPSGMDSWWEDLAASVTSPVDVVVIGDSIAAQGTVADPGWPWLLGEHLARRAGLLVSDQVVFPNGSTSAPPVTTPGGTGTEAGFGGWATSLAAAQNLSHVGDCDAISVVYTGGGGTLTIKDGGSGGTTLATIDTSGESGASKMWTSAALTYESHNIWIGCTVAATVVEAIYMHRGTRSAGVRVWPAVHQGYDSADFTTDTNRALDLIDTIEDAGTLGLVIVATGTNDASPGGAQYTALLDDIEARTSAPIVCWVPYANGALSKSEAATMRATIAVRGYTMVDADTLDPRFGPDKTVDTVHPSQEYQQLLADQVHAVVGGDPIGQALRDVPRLGTAANEAAPGNVIAAEQRKWSVLSDDFLRGALDTTLWTAATGTGGTNVTVSVPSLNHPGAWRVNATSTTGSHSSLTMAVGAFADTTTRFTCWAAMSVAGSAGVNLRMGTATYSGASSVLGAWFEKTAGQTTWRLATQNFLGSVTYTTLSGAGVTLDTNYHEFTIYRIGSVILALIDGVLVGSAAAPGNLGSPSLQAYNSASAACYIDIDRVEFAVLGIDR